MALKASLILFMLLLSSGSLLYSTVAISRGLESKTLPAAVGGDQDPSSGRHIGYGYLNPNKPFPSPGPGKPYYGRRCNPYERECRRYPPRAQLPDPSPIRP